MTKPDQNRVNLGPARIKTDDAIYDAVDQGIVGTTTVVPVQVDPGFVPIGPIGDLITPPVLAPVTGYPIYAVDINFNDGTSTYPFLHPRTSWNVLDLSALGSFTNALVVGAGGSDLAFVNLDNPSQRTTYAGKYKNSPLDFIIRDGVLTHGWSYFVGGVWVTDNVDVTIDAITVNISGTSINTALQAGKSDATHRYFYLGFGWGGQHAYARTSHTGSLSLEVVGVAPAGFNPGANPQSSVRCIATGFIWIGSQLSGPFSERAFAMEIATGATTVLYTITSSRSEETSWFGLTTGEAAYLFFTEIGLDRVYDLRIIGLDGSITNQSNIITLTSDSLAQFVDVSGTDTMLATNSFPPRTLYQISPAGYQIVSGTPEDIQLSRISDASPGALRFWGSTVSTTGVALYEFAL